MDENLIELGRLIEAILQPLTRKIDRLQERLDAVEERLRIDQELVSQSNERIDRVLHPKVEDDRTVWQVATKDQAIWVNSYREALEVAKGLDCLKDDEPERIDRLIAMSHLERILIVGYTFNIQRRTVQDGAEAWAVMSLDECCCVQSLEHAIELLKSHFTDACSEDTRALKRLIADPGLVNQAGRFSSISWSVKRLPIIDRTQEGK